MKARFVEMIGLPGRVASVTSIGIRVRRTASTNTPPCSRTFAMWRSDEVRASVPARLSWKLFMADPGVRRDGSVVGITGVQRVRRGADGLSSYLAFLAAEYPKVHAQLIGKLLPKDIHVEAEVSGGSGITHACVYAVPNGHFLPPALPDGSTFLTSTDVKAIWDIQEAARARVQDAHWELVSGEEPSGEAPPSTPNWGEPDEEEE